MRMIGYARVSTVDQNLDLQRHALRAAGCQVIYEDHGISGVVTGDRDGLSKALADLRQGDLLVVYRIDRLGRSLGFLIELVEMLRVKGGEFLSLSDGIDTTTAGGKLVFHIMGALAEFERALISERTKAGMLAAKSQGKHIGRPPRLSPRQIDRARLLIDRGGRKPSHVAALLGVGVSTLRRALSSSVR